MSLSFCLSVLPNVSVRLSLSLTAFFDVIDGFIFNRYDALEAPLSEKAVELDLAMQFFQFDRDVDDEKVS